ncbi:MAG: hypothetical protein V1870_02485 [Candidatus Aenigmatarchaeota archaeon]
MNASVEFYDEKTQRAYFELKTADPQLFKFLDRATDDIKENPGVGKQIPYKQIPKSFYKNYPHIKGMPIFKYDLPKAWRIIYAVNREINRIEIIAIILDVCDHKNYERLFKYN